MITLETWIKIRNYTLTEETNKDYIKVWRTSYLPYPTHTGKPIKYFTF